MDEQGKILRFALNALVKVGADKAQCQLHIMDKYEFLQEPTRINMLRTTRNEKLSLTAIKDKRLVETTVNILDEANIKSTVDKLMSDLHGSPQDDSYDIAPAQSTEIFDNGLTTPDLRKMYELLTKFIKTTNNRYPSINLHDVVFDFTRETKKVVNTNGADLTSGFGKYSVLIPFSAKDKVKVSSENCTLLVLDQLNAPIQDNPAIDELLRQGVEQLEAKPVPGKFKGDIVIYPWAFDDFIYYLSIAALRDNALLEGNSIYQNKLGKQIADSRLSLHSRPVSRELADGYFITADGHKAQNITLIDNGVLKNFLLSQYGAAKTGLPNPKNDGNCYVVDSGDTSFSDMIKSVRRGLLLMRFLCDNPNKNGDFSGIAKHSYYIEDGLIKFPVTDTMISGNIPQMLMNIQAISRERINTGTNLHPWITCSGVTVSGQ
jgi:PmbA protein